MSRRVTSSLDREQEIAVEEIAYWINAGEIDADSPELQELSEDEMRYLEELI